MIQNLQPRKENKGKQLITKLNLQRLYTLPREANLLAIVMQEKAQAEVFHKEQDQI